MVIKLSPRYFHKVSVFYQYINKILRLEYQTSLILTFLFASNTPLYPFTNGDIVQKRINYIVLQTQTFISSSTPEISLFKLKTHQNGIFCKTTANFRHNC
jgi:hypothetical protein